MPADAGTAGLCRLEFAAMDTPCVLLATSVSPERLERTRAGIVELAARLTRFSASSELSRLNAGAGSWVEVGDALEAVLREALRAHQLSGGLVNCAVLPAMHAAGYTRSLELGVSEPSEAAGPVPPLPDVLEVAPGRARVRPGAGIDLGGIAKGWLADRAAERLPGSVLVNLGGDLRATGGGPEGDGWPVGFGGQTVALVDCGAATSSVLRRAWAGGHHLIDPRTGRPAAGDLAEVSVVAADATLAEIHAKTALLLGSEGAARHLAGSARAWWLQPR